jgi:FlaA1/EpsC-like NDP-sugar epimerase
MGDPVSIDILARRLSRQVAPSRVPDIVYTGLRPGEKLHEILVNEHDDLLEQPHPRLSRYAVPPLEPEVDLTVDLTADAMDGQTILILGTEHSAVLS